MNERPASTLQPPSLRTVVRGLLPSILVNGVLVFVIYFVVKHVTSASDFVALVISAIPAMIYTLLSLIRQRQVDVLGAFALITIAFSIVLTFFSGDVRLFQIRESFLTVLFGLVCLVSLLFPKPLWFYIIRYFTTGNKPEQMATFDMAWQYAGFRTYIRHITIFWGLIYVIEFVIRLVLVYNLPVAQFLLISPFIFYGITIAAIAFTLTYARRLRRRADTRLRQQEMELAEHSTPDPQS
jgi:intracellular septation protein A